MSTRFIQSEGGSVINTRRHPRTLAEAFGPHTSRHVIDTEPSRSGTIAYAVLLVVALIGMGILLAWRG